MASTADHPRPAGQGLVMVRFGLAGDPDGRDPDPGASSPVESEGLWATPVTDGRYRVENTPWFAPMLATGDVVEAVEYEGDRWVMRRMSWSGHLTVRVAHPDPATVLAGFADLGVRGEYTDAYGLAALDIPPSVDLRAVIGRLRAGTAEGTWTFDEACVTPEWRAL